MIAIKLLPQKQVVVEHLLALESFHNILLNKIVYHIDYDFGNKNV